MKKTFIMFLLGITVLSRAYIYNDLLMITTCVNGYEFVTVSPVMGMHRGAVVANDAPVHTVQIYESLSNAMGAAMPPRPKACGR